MLVAQMAACIFPKSHRLSQPQDFDAVFNKADFRVSEPACLMLARRTSAGVNRLGIVVGKRNVPGAVQRNRIKRLVREAFRKTAQTGEGLDTVVLVRSKANGMDNVELSLTMTKMFAKLLGLNQKMKPVQGKEA